MSVWSSYQLSLPSLSLFSPSSATEKTICTYTTLQALSQLAMLDVQATMLLQFTSFSTAFDRVDEIHCQHLQTLWPCGRSPAGHCHGKSSSLIRASCGAHGD